MSAPLPCPSASADVVVCHCQRHCRNHLCCPRSHRRCWLVIIITVIVAAIILSPSPPPAVAVDVAVAVVIAVAITTDVALSSS